MDKITEIAKIQEDLKLLMKAAEKQESKTYTCDVCNKEVSKYEAVHYSESPESKVITGHSECILPKKLVPKKKKVIIMGFAPSWTETPWDDDAEIWTLNEAYRLAEQQPKFRADRWFEIHSLDRPPKNDPKHIEWLKTCPVPLYTLKPWDFLPNAIPFPFEQITKWMKDHGHIGERYFTNSISWMIGFALLEGFEEIDVYGVDMAVDTDKNGNSEYGYQKPSCEYLLGVAEKYAKVFVPKTSDLLFCAKLYAVEQDNENAVFYKKQISALTNQINRLNASIENANSQMRQLENDKNQCKGALETYRILLRKRMI